MESNSTIPGTQRPMTYSGWRTLTSTGGIPAVTLDSDICTEENITEEDVGAMILYHYDTETKQLTIDLSRHLAQRDSSLEPMW